MACVLAPCCMDGLLWLTPEPGCRGVSWHKASERWRASIKIGGKKVSLGSYIDEEQAARIFDSEAVRHGLLKFIRCLILPCF